MALQHYPAPNWTPETLEALEGSIRKWQEIVAGTAGDWGIKNCPLCTMFYNEHAPGDEDRNVFDTCFGCPVAHKVDDSGCAGTPYGTWFIAARAHKTAKENFPDSGIDWPLFAELPQLVELAQKELDFLISLRPENANGQ